MTENLQSVPTVQANGCSHSRECSFMGATVFLMWI